MLPLFGSVLLFLTVPGQELTTYNVDQTFSTGNLFRDARPVSKVLPVENNMYLVAGLFDPSDNLSTFRGLGRVHADGSEDTGWGGAETYSATHLSYHENGYIYATTGSLGKVTTDGVYWNFIHGDNWGDYFKFNPPDPYNVENVWSLYVQDDQKVLIGGAIATDTTQPGLFRNLCRLLPDGSHDPEFPAVEAQPNNPYIYISEITPDNEGNWYVSGNFTGINGHVSNYIARLNPDFSVDESFTSPFQYTNFPALDPEVIFVDSQNRVWVSGYKMVVEDSPTDTLEIARLFPDASFDEGFIPTRLYGEYPETWGYRQPVLAGVMEMEEEGHFILYGQFNIFNDTLQNCITVVDDSGYIQLHYFPGTAADSCHWGPNNNDNAFYRPAIRNITELEDGSLMLGGVFSHFDGEEHYNVVKLNKGIYNSVKEQGDAGYVSIFPNPATETIRLQIPKDLNLQKAAVYDALGRQVLSQTNPGEERQINISRLQAGVYVLKATLSDGKVAQAKFVVQR